MKRSVVLGVLIVAGALSLVFAAQQQAPKVLEVTKLKDNLFVLKGGGGNTAVFIMADGVTVVDAKNPGWGQPILDKIKELTNKPVTRLINTHTHADHVGGNVEFPATIDIVTQENTKTNMEKMVPPTGFPPYPPATANLFKDSNGKGMPKRTFKDKMTIGSGADRVDLYYFGRAHTNGDAWVLFPALRVMHAADVFSDVGTFMEIVGAAWLMVSLNAGPMYVALTQTASALPFFLFALPAGAVGDIVDRRKLILFTETWMAAVAIILAVVTIEGWITPWLLLALTFALSAGDESAH